MNENFNIEIIGGFQQSFDNLCLQILHEGYEFMLTTNRHQTIWAEESLTAHYYWCLNQIDLHVDWKVSIRCEVRQYNENHIFDGFSAKSAPRIDMELSRWDARKELFFRVEAKVLFENDKILPSGSKTKAATGHERYIETGVEHFLNGHYPLPGCLVGYVVEGDTQKILHSINGLLITKGLSPRVGTIQQKKAIIYPELYYSTNQVASTPIILHHFMLKF